MDEAGRGPWAGPVVAAAVVLRRRVLPVRIDDSKRLSARQREQAFCVITACADVGVGIVAADEIDRTNILRASLAAMAEAVEALPVRPARILVDGTATPPGPVPYEPIVHGDRLVYAVSCASIVAKVVRDRLMTFYDDLYPRYAFHRHKGYGTSQHARVLRAAGPCALHRMSFSPVAASLAVSAPAHSGSEPAHAPASAA